jgi:hypothetical protein
MLSFKLVAMKTFKLFPAIVLLLIFPTGCSDDAVLESLVSASRTDHNLVLNKDLGFNRELELKLELDLDLNMDLNAPALKERVSELRDSIQTYMEPEFVLMQELGRKVLRDRGIDPDTAFSEGHNDPRLAMIPFAAEVMDKLNKRFERHGYTIVDLYHPSDSAKVAARHGAGMNTGGPWDDYWAQYDTDAWMEYSEDDLNECFGKVIGEVGGMVGLAIGLLGKAGGRALIAFVGGATVISVGKGISVAGLMYGAYRMGKCLEQKRQEAINGITCSITISLVDYCRNVIESEYSTKEEILSCQKQLFELNRAKFGALDKRLQDDTLALVVSEKFEPDWRETLKRRK